MSEQLAVLKHVAARLGAARILYMVTGSIAAGVYGQPRTTRDIDLVAVLYPPHAPRLPDVLGTEFVVDEATAKDAYGASHLQRRPSGRPAENRHHRQAGQRVRDQEI